MERISSQSIERSEASKFEEAVVAGNQIKNKFKNGFMNYAGIAVGVFLMFVVVVMTTTDITFVTTTDFATLGLNFFLLMFCSYSMYITFADSGMRAGLSSKSYKEATAKYETYKREIVENGYQAHLPGFCIQYIEKELRSAKLEILAVVGITYEQYLEKYVSMDSESLKGCQELSEFQISAIVKANGIAPIKLTPDMFMKRGRGSKRREPLGLKPETIRFIKYGIKFASTLLTTLIMSAMVVNAVASSDWSVFSLYMVKLLSIIMNGFTGYKFGYENIAIDTVSYIDDQVDLLRQAITYASSLND